MTKEQWCLWEAERQAIKDQEVLELQRVYTRADGMREVMASQAVVAAKRAEYLDLGQLNIARA